MKQTSCTNKIKRWLEYNNQVADVTREERIRDDLPEYTNPPTTARDSCLIIDSQR